MDIVLLATITASFSTCVRRTWYQTHLAFESCNLESLIGISWIPRKTDVWETAISFKTIVHSSLRIEWKELQWMGITHPMTLI